MSEDVHSALAFGCRSAAILQPLSLPPHSPLLFPIVTLATRGLDCADRARLQDVVHVAPDRADQAGDAGAHPCRVILAGARLWPLSHRPSRGRTLLILFGRVAATLPRLQVSAPRALPGARFGRHPEAGVSPFRAWPPALHSCFSLSAVNLLALPVGYPHLGRGSSRGGHQLRCHCGLACTPQRFCRHFPCSGPPSRGHRVRSYRHVLL